MQCCKNIHITYMTGPVLSSLVHPNIEVGNAFMCIPVPVWECLTLDDTIGIMIELRELRIWLCMAFQLINLNPNSQQIFW